MTPEQSARAYTDAEVLRWVRHEATDDELRWFISQCHPSTNRKEAAVLELQRRQAEAASTKGDQGLIASVQQGRQERDCWYKKPPGIIIIGVVVTVLGYAIKRLLGL